MTVSSSIGLDERALYLIRCVLDRNATITRAVLFGSRAKGNPTAASVIDLVVEGLADDLGAEALASELKELPLPFRFDVKAAQHIRHAPLCEHFSRVGVTIYPTPAQDAQ